MPSMPASRFAGGWASSRVLMASLLFSASEQKMYCALIGHGTTDAQAWLLLKMQHSLGSSHTSHNLNSANLTTEL